MNMKTLFSTITTFLVMTSFAQKEPVKVAKGHQVEIQTSAICAMCQHAIEYDLTFAKGVKSADLNLDNKVVTIVYNEDKITPEELRTRITKVGYHADFMARDSIAYENLPMCCKDGNHGTPKVQKPTPRKNN